MILKYTFLKEKDNFFVLGTDIEKKSNIVLGENTLNLISSFFLKVGAIKVLISEKEYSFELVNTQINLTKEDNGLLSVMSTVVKDYIYFTEKEINKIKEILEETNMNKVIKIV